MRKGKINSRLDSVYLKAIFQDSLNSKYPSFALDKLVSTFCGGTPDKSNSDFWNGDIFWVSPKDFRGLEILQSEDTITAEGLKKSSTKLVEAENVLLVVRSGILQHTLPVAINKVEVAINQDVKALEIRDKSKLNPYYLTFYFKTFQDKLLPLIVKHGTIVQSVNTEQFDKLKIPVPPLEIQARIVEKFESAYNAKRAKEAEAKAMLDGIDAYLLDKLGIETPLENKTKKIFYRQSNELSGNRFDANSYNAERLTAIEAVKNGKFTSRKLKQIADFPKLIVSETNLSYIGLENIESNTGNYIETIEKQSFGSAVVFDKNQILFPKLRPYLNKVYLAEFDGVCSTEFHILNAKIENLTNEFLSLFLRSKTIVSQTKHLMSGNTLPRLQTEDIENLLIALPPLEIQNEIAAHIQEIRTRAKQLETEARAEIERARAEVERMILGER